MPSHRIEKVSALLKRELSSLINQDFVEDFGLVTVYDIELSADFREAKVFVTIFDQTEEELILKKLADKALNYQHILGRKLKMKFTPRLTFKINHFQEKIDRIDELLKDIDHGA